MRRGLGIVTVIALAILLSGMFISFQMPRYVPNHHLLELFFGAGATYLVLTYRYVRVAEPAHLARVLVVQLALLVITIGVFGAYHLDYTTGHQVDGMWNGDGDAFITVAPFHEQLAVPAILAAVLAPLLTCLAMRTERY